MTSSWSDESHSQAGIFIEKDVRELAHQDNTICFFIGFFFYPGQPIWPVIQSLNRINDWIGFQNYTRNPLQLYPQLSYLRLQPHINF